MQPHRYTRLARAARTSSRPASTMPTRCSIADVYAAGEAPIEGVNRDMLVGPGAARRPSRRPCRCRAPGDLPGLIWQIGAAGRRRGLPRRRQHHRLGACAARPAAADRGRAGRSARDRQRQRSRDGRMMALETALAHLIDRLPKPRGRLTADAPLGPQTWFRAGGPAEVLFRPADAEDLASFPEGAAGRRAGDGAGRRLEPAGARRRHARAW